MCDRNPGLTDADEAEAVDDGAVCRLQTVSSAWLKARWADVEAYDARQADWQRIDDFELDSVERSAVLTVYSALCTSRRRRGTCFALPWVLCLASTWRAFSGM
ncbi:hypothetical protein [Micromonospora sp. NPDC049274]|uniref:hypothetical protein n=1 Tax=Micromonospora sp. NPDC049274 TaxID=3154829 RepID=UPI003436A5E5